MHTAVVRPFAWWATRLFSVMAKRYVREVFPTKGVQTRRDNEKELANLLKVFAHIRDGALRIVQNKTSARLGIEITGELAATIARINARPYGRFSALAKAAGAQKSGDDRALS